jgi:hypothetical protein
VAFTINQHRLVALLALVCMLLAQGVLAAVPCLSPQATAADAFAVMPEGCDETPSANLCLGHCTAPDQTPAHPEVALAPPPVGAVASPPIVATQPLRPSIRRDSALAQGPPTFLRLCSLLL